MFLLLILPVLVAIHIYVERKRGRFYVFDPFNIYTAAVIYSFYIPYLIDSTKYVYLWGLKVDLKVQLLILISYASLSLFYLYLKKVKFSYEYKRSCHYVVNVNRLNVFGIVLVGIGLAGWVSLISSAPSLSIWLSTPRGGTDWENVGGYANQLSHFLIFGVSLYYFTTHYFNSSVPHKITSTIMLVLVMLFMLYLGSRSRFLALFLVYLFVFVSDERKRKGLIRIVTYCLIVYCLIWFQKNYRYNFINLSFNVQEIGINNIIESFVKDHRIFGSEREIDYKTFSSSSELGITYATVRYVPDNLSPNLGVEFLQIITQPIPRQWWPDKRYPRGEAWSDLHLLAGTSSAKASGISVPYFYGPAPGYFASWYYSFLWLGVLIGGLITAIIFRFVLSLYLARHRDPRLIIMFILLLSVGYSEAVSHPLGWIYTLSLIAIPVWIFLKLVLVRIKENRT